MEKDSREYGILGEILGDPSCQDRYPKDQSFLEKVHGVRTP